MRFVTFMTLINQCEGEAGDGEEGGAEEGGGGGGGEGEGEAFTGDNGVDRRCRYAARKTYTKILIRYTSIGLQSPLQLWALLCLEMSACRASFFKHSSAGFCIEQIYSSCLLLKFFILIFFFLYHFYTYIFT